MLSVRTREDFNEFATKFSTDKIKNAYLRNINEFSNYIGKDILQASKQDANNYVDYLDVKVKNGDLSPKSCYNKISSVSSFYTFLATKYEDEHIVNYMLDVNRPDIDILVSKDRIASYEDIDKILNVARMMPDKTMFTLLTIIIKCGLTLSEISNLKKGPHGNIIQDKNGNYGILFMSKYKNRFVKLPDDVITILNDYLDSRTDDEPYVFVQQNGSKLNERAVERRMARIVKKALGTAANLTIRDFRNTSIALMMKNANPEDVNTIAEMVDINPRYTARYKFAVEAFDKSPTDLINIKINPS